MYYVPPSMLVKARDIVRRLPDAKPKNINTAPI
jgi:hypothetical protein